MKFTLLFISVLLTTCSKGSEPISVIPDPKAVQFNASIDPAVLQPKATNAAWTVGDAIGVFMVANKGNNVVENAANKKYITRTGNRQFTADGASSIYYPQNGSKVDFITYYPFRTDISALGSYNVNVSDQSKPENIDLLYAATPETHPAGFNHSHDEAIALKFRYQLSKLTLNIAQPSAELGISQEELSSMTAMVTGLSATASFDLATGTWGNVGSPQQFNLYTVTPGKVYSAIILPGKVAAGSAKIKFTAGKKQYIWEIPGSIFESGKEYTFTVTLSPPESGIVFKKIVHNTAELLQAMEQAQGGDTIGIAPGNYTQLVANNIHKTSMVTIMATDRNHPPRFTPSPYCLELRRLTNFTFEGFFFDGSEMKDEFGYPHKNGIAVRYGYSRNLVFRNCTFDFWHIGIDPFNGENNVNYDCIIEYNKFTRRGMDCMRFFRKQVGLIIRNNVSTNDYIDVSRSHESDRHPDIIQFAAVHPYQPASIDVVIESNKFMLADLYSHVMYIISEAVCKKGITDEDWYPKNFIIRNNDFMSAHINSVAIGGHKNALIEGNKIHKSPGTFELGKPLGTPSINSYGFNNGLVIRNNTGPGKFNVQTGYEGTDVNVTVASDNVWNAGAVPAGWVDLTNLTGPYAYENK